MILVLHIRGVLHRVGGEPFEYLPVLERVLRFREDVHICVLENDNQEPHSLADLASHLSQDLHSRLLGDAHTTDAGKPSCRVALTFLVQRGKGSIEVGGVLHLRHWYNVVECDPERGLDRAALLQLRCALLPQKAEFFFQARPSWSPSYRSQHLGDLLNDAVERHKRNWVPVAFTLITNADVLAYAIRSGVLAKRLFRGLEAIYICEFSLLLMPRLIPAVRQLVHQFPDRLRVAPLDDWLLFDYRSGLKQTGTYASEFLAVGRHLHTIYADHVQERPQSERPRYLFRIGRWPRRAQWFIREVPVVPGEWESLDLKRMQELDDQAEQRRAEHEKRAIEVLAQSITPNRSDE